MDRSPLIFGKREGVSDYLGREVDILDALQAKALIVWRRIRVGANGIDKAEDLEGDADLLASGLAVQWIIDAGDGGERTSALCLCQDLALEFDPAWRLDVLFGCLSALDRQALGQQEIGGEHKPHSCDHQYGKDCQQARGPPTAHTVVRQAVCPRLHL